MYAVYHGPEGLRTIALRTHRYAAVLAAALREAGAEVRHEQFFDTVTVRVPGGAAAVVDAARERGVHLRLNDDDTVGISTSETTGREHLERRARRVRGRRRRPRRRRRPGRRRAAGGAASARREYLTHEVFNTHRSETSMLRYLRRLSARDYALDRGMIPLGSCTMKLNATTEMEPVSLPGFADLHPFAPAEDAEGYATLIEELESWLAEVTGYDRVSIQPNAGSQGELAGLLAIRAYHVANGHADARHLPDPVLGARHQRRLRGDGRDAGGGGEGGDRRPGRHGRPARAVREARRGPRRDHGDLPLDPRRLRGRHQRAVRDRARARRPGVRRRREPQRAARLRASRASSAATSRTSTCTRRSASRTAAAVRASGRSACASTSRRTCPRTRGTPTTHGGRGIGPVSAAPYGSAGILPISWAYVRMMGGAGLTDATAVAVLSANYVAKRLARALPGALQGTRRPRRARVHPRPPRADQHDRRDRRRRREAAGRLRLPRADDELPGGRHADGRADRVRGPRRDRPVLRGDDRHPRRDRPGRGGGVDAGAVAAARRAAHRPRRSPASGTGPTPGRSRPSRPATTRTSTGRRWPASTRPTATATWSAPARRPRRSRPPTRHDRPSALRRRAGSTCCWPASRSPGGCPRWSAGVVRDGGLVWTGSVGGSTAPPAPDVQYRIGSITKTLVAVLVLQLRDEGTLDLNDRLDVHLPGVRLRRPDAARPARARLRHALRAGRVVVGAQPRRLVRGARGGARRRSAAVRRRRDVPLHQRRLRSARRGGRPAAGRFVVGPGRVPDPHAAGHDADDVPPAGAARDRLQRAPLRRHADRGAVLRRRRDGAGGPGVEHGRGPGDATRRFLLSGHDEVLARATLDEMATPQAGVAGRGAGRGARSRACSSRTAGRGCSSGTPARCPASWPGCSSTPSVVRARW